MSILSLLVNTLKIACVFGVWVTRSAIVKISDIHTSHTSGWLRCKGWCMYMCRPCVTCKDPVEWQVISLLPPQSTPPHMSVFGLSRHRWGKVSGSRWASSNRSVECLIDQTREPWGDCLSGGRSLNRSHFEGLISVVSACRSYLFLLLSRAVSS